jgi:hypothetical protein
MIYLPLNGFRQITAKFFTGGASPFAGAPKNFGVV